MNYKIVFLSLISCHYMYGMERCVPLEVVLCTSMEEAISENNDDGLASCLQSDAAQMLFPQMREYLLNVARRELDTKQRALVESNYAFTRQVNLLHSNLPFEEKLRVIQQTKPQLLASCQQAWDAVQQGIKVYNWFLAYKYFENLRFPQAIFNPPPRAPKPRITVDNHLIALIRNEQDSIDACVFHFTLYNVAKELVKAHERGVRVALITSYKQSDFNPVLHALNYLVAHDIPVYTRGSRFETNYHKFILFGSNIFNQPLAWIGSANITGYSCRHSLEDAAILNDRRVVFQYARRFDEVLREIRPLTLDGLKKQQAKSNPSEFSLRNNNVPPGYFDNEGVFQEGSPQ